MKVTCFLFMLFDLNCISVYLQNLKPTHKHKHTHILRSSLHLLNQNLQSWSFGTQTFLKCHRKWVPSTDEWWEYTLVQILEINLAAFLLLGIFFYKYSQTYVNRSVYRVVNCSIADLCQRLETTCKCISRGLAKLVNRATQYNTIQLLKVLS